MKWIATILSVYIMALFAVPCSDANNNCQNFSQTSTEAPHHHSQDNDDYCSPFCQCTCCSISATTFYSKLPELSIPQIFSVKKELIWNCKWVSAYAENIWQPPKFS